MFHVGQQVVCVDDSPRYGFRPPLTKGCIYTLRQIILPGDLVNILEDGTQITAVDHGVRLIEIDDPPVLGRARGRYYVASRFRPVRKTDISIFTAMLAPTPKERVGA